MKTSLSSTVPLLVVMVLMLAFFNYKEEQASHPVSLPELEEGEVINVIPAGVEPIPAQREQVQPEQPLAQTAASPTPNEGESPELVALRTEVQALRTRIHGLEVELSLKEGQLAQWVVIVRPEQRPSQEMLKLMAEYLHDYPVALRYEEGLWLAERIEKNDWKLWGPTVDEAIFTYLGEARLSKELTPEQFSRCKP